MEDINEIIGGKYKILRGLNAGSFGKTYMALDRNQLVAVKVEVAAKRPYQFLPNEYRVYQKIKGSDGFPRVHTFIGSQTHNVLVMDLLGPNLEEVFCFCCRQLTYKTVIMLVDQVLERLESLHKFNFIHRDIKPENFLLGTGRNAHKVYAVDFGLLKSYRYDCTLTEIPTNNKRNAHMIGTPRYASISAHLGKDQYKADDLESLAYMMIYLYTGKLPWEGVEEKSRNKRFEIICEMKQSIAVEELCSGCPEQFAMFVEYCRNLKRSSEPDYAYLHYILRSALTATKQEFDFDYDWHIMFHHPVDEYYGNLDLIYSFFPKGNRLPKMIRENVLRKSLCDYIVRQKERERLMYIIPFKKLERYTVEIQVMQEIERYDKKTASCFERLERRLLVTRMTEPNLEDKMGLYYMKKGEKKRTNKEVPHKLDNLEERQCDKKKKEKKTKEQEPNDTENELDKELDQNLLAEKQRQQEIEEEEKKWLKREKRRQQRELREKERKQKELEQMMSKKELEALKKQQEEEELKRKREQWLRIEAKEKERLKAEKEEEQRRKQEERERLRCEKEREKECLKLQKEEEQLRLEYQKYQSQCEKVRVDLHRKLEREQLQRAKEQQRIKLEKLQKQRKREQEIEQLTHDVHKSLKHSPFGTLDDEKREQLRQLIEEARQEVVEEMFRKKAERERQEFLKKQRYLWAVQERQRRREQLKQDYDVVKNEHEVEDIVCRAEIEQLCLEREREEMELEYLRKQIQVENEKKWAREQYKKNCPMCKAHFEEIEHDENQRKTPQLKNLTRRESQNKYEQKRSTMTIQAGAKQNNVSLNSQRRLISQVEQINPDSNIEFTGFSKYKQYVQELFGKILGK